MHRRFALLVLGSFAWLPTMGCGSSTQPPSLTAEQEQQRQKEMQRVEDEERQNAERSKAGKR